MSKIITFVTGNANKLKEFVAIITDGRPDAASSPQGSVVGNYLIVNEKLDLEELQGTVEEVTIDKAKRAAANIRGPVIVEDTCLVFNAFSGLPGPYIKWFVSSLGAQGTADMLYKFEDKSAKAICTFGYCEGPGKEVQLFQGVTDGTIVDSRGPTNFGWDSIFQPIGFDQTYAEMDKNLKNSISHRYRALDKLKKSLFQ